MHAFESYSFFIDSLKAAVQQSRAVQCTLPLIYWASWGGSSLSKLLLALVDSSACACCYLLWFCPGGWVGVAAPSAGLFSAPWLVRDAFWWGVVGGLALAVARQPPGSRLLLPGSVWVLPPA